jgi:hypothetical protein
LRRKQTKKPLCGGVSNAKRLAIFLFLC